MTLRILLLTFALAACHVTSESDPSQAPPPRTEQSPAKPASPAAEPASPPAASVLALDGEGFRIIDSSSGSTRALPFGAEAEQALAAVTRLRGEPERGTNAECGAGPLDYASWKDGLTVHASEGRFVGWSAAEARLDTTKANSTMAGVGVGSTRADLEDAYVAAVKEATLGTEFEAGGFFGLLSGDGPDAEVTFMWAGVSCNFR